MFPYRLSKNLQRILKKLSRKDKKLYQNLLKKINDVANSLSIKHYKNLKYGLKDFKRVHVGSFVLIFRFDYKEKTIFFEDFAHHDDIYGGK